MLQIVLLLGSKPGNNINIVIDNEVVVIVVVSTDCLKLLGVSMDRQLRFHDHISIIYKKLKQSACRSPDATKKRVTYWY